MHTNPDAIQVEALEEVWELGVVPNMGPPAQAAVVAVPVPTMMKPKIGPWRLRHWLGMVVKEVRP